MRKSDEEWKKRTDNDAVISISSFVKNKIVVFSPLLAFLFHIIIFLRSGFASMQYLIQFTTNLYSILFYKSLMNEFQWEKYKQNMKWIGDERKMKNILMHSTSLSRPIINHWIIFVYFSTICNPFAFEIPMHLLEVNAHNISDLQHWWWISTEHCNYQSE